MLSTAPSAAQSACSRGSASKMGRGGGAVVLSPRARQALFALPAFRHLGAAERTQAAGFFREVALGKDEPVYRAGDDADAIYLVVSGAVDLLDGAELFARQGPGEVFGEGALVAGERRAFTARGARQCVLACPGGAGGRCAARLHGARRARCRAARPVAQRDRATARAPSTAARARRGTPCP